MPAIDDQPYDSSDLEELMDNVGGWAQSWDDVLWYINNEAVYDADFAQDEIRPMHDAILEVKKKNLPFTTDYRVLYEYITGKPCADCKPSKGVKNWGFSDREIAERWLKGLKFPATKEQALAVAKKNQTPENIINLIERVKGKEFKAMGMILEQIGDLTWDHD